MEKKNSLFRGCLFTYVVLLAIILLFVVIGKFLTSDAYVWNFTKSNEDVYRYIAESNSKFNLNEECDNIHERLLYLYNHNNSLTFDSILTEILSFRTKDGYLKDSRTIEPVLMWCKERGVKYPEIKLLRDSFLSIKRDSVWKYHFDKHRSRTNSVIGFLRVLDDAICYMMSDTLAWKKDVDLYEEVTSCKAIREGFYERLLRNGRYSADSTQIPTIVKSHSCLFHDDEYINDAPKRFGFVFQNDTVCVVISVKKECCVIDRFYYGNMVQEDCQCHHFWHDRMNVRIKIEDPQECLIKRDSIFSHVHLNEIKSHFE